MNTKELEIEIDEKDIEFDYFDKEDFEDTVELTDIIEKTQKILLDDIKQGEKNAE